MRKAVWPIVMFALFCSAGCRPYSIIYDMPTDAPYSSATRTAKRVFVLVNNRAYKPNKREYAREYERQNREVIAGRRPVVSVSHNEIPEFSPNLENALIQHCIEAGLDVVERRDLKKLVDEIDLQQSSIIDEQTACRYGKLLGADSVILVDVTDCTASDIYVYRLFPGRGFTFVSSRSSFRTMCVFKLVSVETGRVLMTRSLQLSAHMKVVGRRNLLRMKQRGGAPEETTRLRERCHQGLAKAFLAAFKPPT